MRIVIDMQGAQTASRFRGIGRYTMALADAVVRINREHEIILALNGLFSDTIEPIRAAFDGLLPQDNIRVWSVPSGICDSEPANAKRRDAAEVIREAFLAHQDADLVHVSSLFEGYLDDAAVSIGRLATSAPVSVTLYDLIPQANPEHYLCSNEGYAAHYRRKYQMLSHAAGYLGISEFTCEEGIRLLKAPSSRFWNISGACDDCFVPQFLEDHERKALRSRFGIARDYVLYTGGADQRKNLPRLIEAVALLPAALRAGYSLVLAGKLSEGEVVGLRAHAQRHGLPPECFVFTGYVSDQDLACLYGDCALFVFPSWQEGFGLPVLEAMACGAPVIASGTSSIPEVMGLEAAMFDPLDTAAIARQIERGLTDKVFRGQLVANGRDRARQFSWEKTAEKAIKAWENIVDVSRQTQNQAPRQHSRRKLAFVSPLPPARTGIADYSAELLPALAQHFDITLVAEQEQVAEELIGRFGPIRNSTWLLENADVFEHVVYQMGNSPFHKHMLQLLPLLPGTLVLHDFFLSSLIAWLETSGESRDAWMDALRSAHGLMAVRDRIVDADQARNKYPVNFTAIANARGIIFHSHHAQKLLGKAFPNTSLPPSTVVPLPRTLAQREERSGARSRLGIPQDAFVVCSFGFLDASKLNHRLFEAWRQSCLGQDALCHLIFVGENEGGDYGHALRSAIANSGASNRIRITGFTSAVDYRGFLSAADVGVQLRTQSRGETSAAVLDCMNYGVPVIVNAHAAMAELDANTVCMLSDEFHDQELINALETLRRDAVKRRRYGVAAADYMAHSRRPEQTAEAYRSALTQYEKSTRISAAWLARTIAAKTEIPIEDPVLPLLAQSIATTFPGRCAAPKIWIDVTGTYGGRLRTGIERVAASLTSALMEVAPPEFHIEPVCLRQAGSVWRHVSVPSFAMASLGCPGKVFSEAFVSPAPGDIVLALDLAGGAFTQAVRAGLFAEYRARGVQTFAMVHDLLPIAAPQVFPPGADTAHREWVESVSSLDGAICVSQAVAHDLHKWLRANGKRQEVQRSLRICVSHHGAEFMPSIRSTGMPSEAPRILQAIGSRPTFVMVGTIEPRKGYLQVIEAFNCMWRDGYDVGLAIVGAEGWTHLPKEMRRDIPETVQRIRGNVEFNRRLFWCEGISDEYLERVYEASRCLIAASYGEGFGLPLIEAARHRLPIIARDIPVFREVAGDRACYFSGTAPEAVAAACLEWMKLFEANSHPRSEGMLSRTWTDSAATLLGVLRGPLQNTSHSGEMPIDQRGASHHAVLLGSSGVPA